MIRQRYEPTWPFLCILICLFVLSATSPSVWQRAAKSRASRKVATLKESSRNAVASSAVAPTSVPRFDASEIAAAPSVVRTPAEPAMDIRDLGGSNTESALVRLSQTPAPKADQTAKPAAMEPVVPSPMVASKPSIAGFGPLDMKCLDELKLLRKPLRNELPAGEAATEEAPALKLWQEPVALLDQLDDLAHECETRLWAVKVQETIGSLGKALELNAKNSSSLLGELDLLRQEAEGLASRSADAALASKLRRTGFSLSRRLVVWKQAMLAGGLSARMTETAERDPQRLATCLAEVAAFTGDTAEGRAWSKYLALDGLCNLAAGRAVREAESRELARQVLRRLTTAPMSQQQREFLTEGPMASLATELRRWSVDSVEMSAVLRHLEQFERTGAAEDARRLADDSRLLALAPEAAKQELGRQLDAYYRNANVRIAVSKDFLNRLIPSRPTEYGCVNDVVAGKRVQGRSTTSTEVCVRLIPDSQRLRMALEINGLVSSLTESHAGPATFFNRSKATYRAWKEVEVGSEGMELKRAQVSVAGDLRLHALATNFDGVPLLGALVQNVARSQHEQRREEMTAEVETKVNLRAKEQIDDETDGRMRLMSDRLKDRLLNPLTDLSLNPTLVAAETTSDRAVLRLRLASGDQLGAHTPRPRAPSDSLLSVQVHESALNNLVQQLQLDGGTFSVGQLRRRLATRLNLPEIDRGATENDDITISFAAKNAAQVHCQDGQVVVTLAVARITKDSQAWENFQVRAFYRPEVTGRIAVLVREDVIHLIGDRLNTRSQIALRGIFSRVFSKDQPIPLVPRVVLTDPRMAGLVVTQFELEDGWIGLAFGQDQPHRLPAVAQRRHLLK